jgi:hypothetical protein
MTVTPWWQTLKLRSEITDAAGNVTDVQMSLYRVVHGHQGSTVVYAEPDYFSDITHPTPGLVDLMASIAVRLGAREHSQMVKPVWRGDQGMGGGKSHGLVGLFHMAHSPIKFATTSLGRKVRERAEHITGEPLAENLGDPTVVVLSCDELDPFHTEQDWDGPAQTLGERWLWRLVREDNTLYKRYRSKLGTKHGVGEAIEAVGTPVLTLIDEILDYLRKATSGADQERATQDLAFLTNLLEATTEAPNAALVIVMISSEDDVVAMTEFGEATREELEGKLNKYAVTTATTSGGDFAEIIRRRLFETPPAAEVIAATAEAFSQMPIGWSAITEKFDWWGPATFHECVARSYPFHPALIEMVEREWSRNAGFQKVRSTIQIFAAAVWCHQRRAAADVWVPPLIGIGDLPLSDQKTREAILNSGIVDDRKTVSNYREIAASDVVDNSDTKGVARRLDLTRDRNLFTSINPRIAERMATAIFLTSLAPRAQGVQGATDNELKVAAFVPDPQCTLPLVDAVLTDLVSDETGLATLDIKQGKGGQARRLMLSTKQTLPMFFRAQRNAVEQEAIDDALRQEAQTAMTGGPFRARFVSAAGHDLELTGRELTERLIEILEGHGLDDDSNRLFLLDPSAFTILNGVDAECRMALGAMLNLRRPHSAHADQWWPEPRSAAHASSCVFGVVNTYRRKTARKAAADFVAWGRVLDIDVVRNDELLKENAEAERRRAKQDMGKYLRDAFQHVVYVTESIGEDGATVREAATIRFDKANQTALNGETVWAALVESDKAFSQDEFDLQALLHNLRPSDWGKPLREIRDAFYSSPRLGLLYGGDADLKRALFHAVAADAVRVVSPSGDETEPEGPGDINVQSSGLRLERPAGVGDVAVPDLHGMTVQQAAAAAAAVGLAAGPLGEGRVIGQHPGPGELVGPGTEIELIVAKPDGLPEAEGDETTPVPPHTPGPSPTYAKAEDEVSFTLMGLAFDNDGARSDAYTLLSELAALIDNGDASHIQLTINVSASRDELESVLEAAARLGVVVRRRQIG